MRPNAPERRLRGLEPFLVEIEVNTLSTKPLNQIAAANVADLYALDELEDLSTGLRVRLKGFGERMERAVSDLPPGRSFLDWLEALSEVEPARVPTSLRLVIEAQKDAKNRGEAEVAAVQALEARWADTEPEPFSMAAAKPRHVAPVAGAPRTRRTPEQRSRRGGGGGGRSSSPSRPAKALEPVDRDRQVWLEQLVLERLDRAVDQGLLQTVLVAGIKHRARQKYPDMTPKEITSALQTLESKGRLKRTAARWKRTDR